MPRKKIEPPAETPRVELPPLDTGPIFEQLRSASRVIHGEAKCRWCGGRFVAIYENRCAFGPRQWICQSFDCAERQIARAMRLRSELHTEGMSPFLYLPLPLQIDMRESKVKRLLVAGAAGACKSFGARWFLYDECRETEGLQCLLIRCTLKQLEDNHLKFMERECTLLGDAKFNAALGRSKVTFENTSQIHAGYCDSENDIQGHMGPEWDRIVIEEANALLPKANNEIPTRDRGSPHVKIAPGASRDGRSVLLANPGGRGTIGLIDFHIARNPDPEEYPHYDPNDYGFIHASLDDNPYLKEDYAQRSLGALSAARYRQLRNGDWTVTVGQFFSSFSSETHIVETR